MLAHTLYLALAPVAGPPQSCVRLPAQDVLHSAGATRALGVIPSPQEQRRPALSPKNRKLQHASAHNSTVIVTVERVLPPMWPAVTAAPPFSKQPSSGSPLHAKTTSCRSSGAGSEEAAWSSAMGRPKQPAGTRVGAQLSPGCPALSPVPPARAVPSTAVRSSSWRKLGAGLAQLPLDCAGKRAIFGTRRSSQPSSTHPQRTLRYIRTPAPGRRSTRGGCRT